MDKKMLLLCSLLIFSIKLKIHCADIFIIKENFELNETIEFYPDDNYTNNLINYEKNFDQICVISYAPNLKQMCRSLKKDKGVLLLLIEDMHILRGIHDYIGLNLYSFNNISYDHVAFLFKTEKEPITFMFQDINFPVFTANSTIYNKIYFHMFDAGFELTDVSIAFDNTKELIPISYITVNNLSTLALTSCMFIWWNWSTFIKNRSSIGSIQKAMTILIYLKVSLVIVHYFYIRDSIAYNVSLNDLSVSFKRNLFETVMMLLTAIYKTVFWTLMLLISHGWKVCYENLRRSEMKHFATMYMLMYFAVCIDQILDITYGKLGKFYPSEIKNFLLILIVSIVISFKLRKLLRIIKRKLDYSANFAPEFRESLQIKRNIIKSICLLIMCYSVSYVILNVTFSLFYSMNESYSFVVNSVNNNSFDLFFHFLFLIVLRSRNFPQFYNVDLITEVDRETRNEIRVFSVYLNEDKPTVSTNFPIVIVNPFGTSFYIGKCK